MGRPLLEYDGLVVDDENHPMPNTFWVQMLTFTADEQIEHQTQRKPFE